MKKVITLTACLALCGAALFAVSTRSRAQLTTSDELIRRKAAAAESKAHRGRPTGAQDFERVKDEARASKGSAPTPAAGPEPAQLSADVLEQSALRLGVKDAAAADAGRSLEMIQKFDELRAKAQAAGSVRVIVGLRAGFAPEGDLPTSAAVEAQREGIVAAQDVLLSRLAPFGGASVKRFKFIPFVALEVDAAGVEQLRSSPEVNSVGEDIAVLPSLAESAPLVGAPAAWADGFTGSGQAVAVIDTGVDKFHPFLAGKVVSEACFSTSHPPSGAFSVCPNGATQSTAPGSGLNCSDSVDGCDHGTHVAGIAAGRGPSFSGVARDANIIAVQVFHRRDDPADCRGDAPCVRTFLSDVTHGLERVYELRNTHRIAAANLSLGGGQFSSNCDSHPNHAAVLAAVNNLRSAGIATVVASGNEGFKGAIASPACLSSTISVGSTGDGAFSSPADVVSEFSNSASILGLLAPGSLIRSSVPGGAFSNFSGTSMAAPHVAGAWAVLKSRRPSATVTQVFTALKDTGRPITDVNGITKPRIRVDAAADALVGGGGGGTPGPGCGAPLPIGTGQTVNGALASTDCRYPAGGDRFADAYTFTGTAGQRVAVTLTSTAFDSFLYLLGPNGAVVASDDDGGGNLNSRIPPSSGFITLPSSGTYTIQASSFAANTSGTYTLSLAAQSTDGCGTVTPLAFGQTVNGALATSDCRLNHTFIDKYSFSGRAGQQIALQMSASDFDTFLFLLRPDGTILASDDDGGGGLNSRIPPGSGTLTLPVTGTYTVYASSFAADATGSYSLTLSQQASNCPPSAIALGQTVNGALATSDCRLSDGAFFDSYTFTGTAGQHISLRMSSATFDTYLLLLRPDGSLLAEDDDGGGGLNSRIPAGSGALALPVTGTYRVLAKSFSPNVTGSYSLQLSGSGTVSCSPTPIAFGQTVNGALTTSDCHLPDGSFADAYTFTGAAGQRVAVTMTSLTFDTFLFLLGPNGLVVDDDDGGGGVNSRIPPGSGFYTLPSSGAYTILANSFSSNATGNYSLSLVSAVAGCSFSINPTVRSFSPAGGAGSVSVSAGAGCGWAAVSNAPWLSVTGAAAGSGNGTVSFSVGANNTAEARTGTLTVAGRTLTVNQAARPSSTLQLAVTAIDAVEAARAVQLDVIRMGDLSAPASVDFATADGSADRRKDYTQALGRLSFAPHEASKTVAVFITDDVFPEAPETFSLALSNAAGATLGASASAVVTINSDDAALGPNPVDSASFSPAFFVRQHYIDFLNREPDAGGLAFWTNNFTQCGANRQCIELRKVNVSAAFFLSIEFQETGYLVYRTYKAAFGDATSPGVPGTVPVVRLDEFLPDMQRIGRGVQVGVGAWQRQLEDNKNAYALEFVQRPRFTAAFPATLTPALFVDRLNQRAGGVLSAAERNQLVAELTSSNSPQGRAGVLRKVAEDANLRERELRRAFVLMQYFGYLRRNPNDPQDTNFGGWRFWLDKLNQHDGDFVSAEMVKAFIISIEYKNRFGQ